MRRSVATLDRVERDPAIRRRPWQGLVVMLAVGVAVGALGVAARPAAAVEQWRPFLDGLRERGLGDMALAYLDRMAASPDCPAELKSVIDYEAGITLMSGSRLLRVSSARAQALDQARDRLEKFLATHPNHAMASSARTHLANVLVERGRMKVDQAGRPGTSPEEKTRLLAEARDLYGEARTVFAKAEEHFVEVLLPLEQGLTDPKDVKRLEARDQARRDLLEARLFLATAVYEIAMTHPAGSDPRKELLTDSAKRYHAIYERYEKIGAGVYARMWEGRSYKDLGDVEKAMRIFDELLAQPDDPQLHDSRNKTTLLVLQTLAEADPKQVKDRWKTAIGRFEEWEKTARGADESGDEGLAIRFLAAGAYLEQARSLKQDDPQRGKLLAAARKALEFVGRFPGDYQQPAKMKMLDALLGKPDAKLPDPTSFAEATERAKAALDRMQAAELQDRLDQSQGKKDNHARYQEEMAEARDEAFDNYRAALGMAGADTPLEELNTARYYLAYLYWIREDPYRAAVLGDFLARRYPDSIGARQGAKIAMAAYAKLAAETSSDAQRDFAHARMVATADFITRRWPDGPEAADAFMTLLRTAIVGGNLDAARGLLEKLPSDSPRRADAELTLGRALWAKHLQAMRLDDAERPGTQELDKLLAEARDRLAAGITGASKAGEVDGSLFAAALALAQIHLHDGKPAEAVKLLEDPRIGPVTLVKAKHLAAAKEGYAVETYKAALRAYVAAGQLEKAEQTMDSLEALVKQSGDAGASSKLTQIYISLGRELQELLESLRKQKKTDQLAEISGGFELFLNRISERQQGNTFNSLGWVAETFLGMGAGFDPGSAPLPAAAEKYYRKAADTYQDILTKCEADASFAPQPEATDGVKVRLAQCLRRLGRYDEAMKFLVDVLKYRNMMVDAQVQAAYTYQAWATTPGNAKRYLSAIVGGYRAKKKDGSAVNLVWGWGKIAKLVARSTKYLDVFHEARYNLALCRFEYALALDGAEKTKTLEMAENDVIIIQRLYPDMGGEAWRAKYDALLKKIQGLLGKKQVGLGGKP